MEYKYLPYINSPDDVKKIPPSELGDLCAEIRDCLIKTVLENGGHLSSNLGVVELTVALHRVFNSPEDSIIFDVGHQCYTHKLLTGRFDKFSTIRKEGGLSGFMRPDESEHDAFITGHSSNSISAAYGIAKAKQLLSVEGTSVAVVGDGSMTGGLAYEALNNSGTTKKNFIVILNDNKMSISKNVGALSRYLNAVRMSKGYHSFKLFMLKFLAAIPVVGNYLRKSLLRSKLVLKSSIYGTNIFEGFGFHYLGPVDGHNIEKLEQILNIAKEKKCPVLVHVITQKGRGYELAENKPTDYHGVSPFDINEGALTSNSKNFSSVFGSALTNIAEKDERVCAVTAAMIEGTGLSEFYSKYPQRLFDVGIAEQHAITFSAAMASKGIKPYFAVYSSFLQRGFDQVIHDAAIASLPITICVDRAGFVGEDGVTHNGLLDAAYLSLIPNVTVYSPSYYSELEYLINSSLNFNSPTAIRYPRGGELSDNSDGVDFTAPYSLIGFGGDTVIVTYGRIFANAKSAAERLLKKGKKVSVLKLNRISPIDVEIVEVLKKFKRIYFFEEGVRHGGIGEHLGNMLFENRVNAEYFLNAVDDGFVRSAPVSSLLKKYKFDIESMVNIVGGK